MQDDQQRHISAVKYRVG